MATNWRFEGGVGWVVLETIIPKHKLNLRNLVREGLKSLGFDDVNVEDVELAIAEEVCDFLEEEGMLV